MKSSYFKFSAIFLTAVFVGGIIGGIIGSVFIYKMYNPKMQVYLEDSQVINVVKKVSPSVVSVVNEIIKPVDSPLNDPFYGFAIPSRTLKVSEGSGFIISATGIVVTNRHVVQDETAKYKIVLNDGREFSAEVLTRSDLNDFAVLRIKAHKGKSLPNLTPVILGDSDANQIGQEVIAIGNALARQKNTVTTGVIGGIGLSLGKGLVNLIQTDAAINQGNSGGPLVNLAGQVIGINTATAKGMNGINYVIPINDVKPIIDIAL